MSSTASPPPEIPCPVQRALWKAGLLGDPAPLGPFAALLVHAFGARGSEARRLKLAVEAIAAVSNGFDQVFRNVRSGFRPTELRGGPLDKRGGGTRILSQTGQFDEAEFVRFETFARPFVTAAGESELGVGRQELTRYLDANQARGGGGVIQRRILMEGELPQLLALMGKGEGENRYLATSEVKKLYRDNEFPDRIISRVR